MLDKLPQKGHGYFDVTSLHFGTKWYLRNGWISSRQILYIVRHSTHGSRQGLCPRTARPSWTTAAPNLMPCRCLPYQTLAFLRTHPHPTQSDKPFWNWRTAVPQYHQNPLSVLSTQWFNHSWIYFTSSGNWGCACWLEGWHHCLIVQRQRPMYWM